MTEQELYDTLFTRLCDSKEAHYAGSSKWMCSKEFLDESIPKVTRDTLRATLVPPIYEVEAYAELAKDTEVRTYDANRKIGEDERPKRTRVPAGTTVRIVMCSRLGDMGITRNLDTQHGYETRVHPGDGYLTNCRLTREDSIR